MMKPDLMHEEGQLQELHRRHVKLRALAGKLTSDSRWLSTSLAAEDPLVAEARSDKISPPWPLTIGTLLAAVLSETDSVESAIHCYERRLHPKHAAHLAAQISVGASQAHA